MQQLAAAAINDRAFEIAEREILFNSNRSVNNAGSQAPDLPENLIATSGSRVTEEVRQQVPQPQRNTLDPAPVQTSSSLSIGASSNNPGGSSNRHVNLFSLCHQRILMSCILPILAIFFIQVSTRTCIRTFKDP